MTLQAQTTQTTPQTPPVASKRGLVDVLINRWSGLVGVCALLISLFLPTEGLGINLCFFYDSLSLPCPGCGLTRSVTNITHFQWGSAWRYNPFGFVAYGTFLFMAICAILPRTWLESFRNTIQRQEERLVWIMMAVLTALMVHGIARLIFYAASGMAFPALY